MELMCIKPCNLMRIKGLMCIMEHDLMCINDLELLMRIRNFRAANVYYGNTH